MTIRPLTGPMQCLVDEEVVAGVEAMEAFIREQRPALLAFMRGRMRTEEDAEEAVQDCFMRLLRYEDKKPASAWRFVLYRIATNVATDHYRRGKSHRATNHVSLDGLAVATSDPSQEQRLADQQELAQLRAAILDLPPKCRQVFLLNRVHGLSYAEVARHCGISVKMVEKHIRKAATLCQARVERGR